MFWCDVEGPALEAISIDTPDGVGPWPGPVAQSVLANLPAAPPAAGAMTVTSAGRDLALGLESLLAFIDGWALQNDVLTVLGIVEVLCVLLVPRTPGAAAAGSDALKAIGDVRKLSADCLAIMACQGQRETKEKVKIRSLGAFLATMVTSATQSTER